MMTLAELLHAYPQRFYSQTWYRGHAFLHEQPDGQWPARPPDTATMGGVEPAIIIWEYTMIAPVAVLAELYCDHPADPVWRARYFWTSTLDDEGQRVYVGDNGEGLEIHRHIHITERFGVPVWK